MGFIEIRSVIYVAVSRYTICLCISVNTVVLQLSVLVNTSAPLATASDPTRQSTNTSRIFMWEDKGSARQYWSLSNMGVTRYCLQVGIDGSGLVTAKELITTCLSSALNQQMFKEWLNHLGTFYNSLGFYTRTSHCLDKIVQSLMTAYELNRSLLLFVRLDFCKGP